MNNATQLADWVRKVRELARRAGRNDVLESLDVEVAGFRRDTVHVVVAGGANAGKSTRINALLGRNLLPVSSVRSSAGISIQHAEDEGVTIDGRTKPLSELAALHAAVPGAELDVALVHDWLHTTGIRILERPPLDASDDETEAVLRAILRGADAVVLIVDALMPVTRVDATLLVECARRGLPLVIVLAKCDHLTGEERASVIEYVQTHVERTGLAVPLIASDLATGSDALRAAIESTVASADLRHIRMRQARKALLTLVAALELVAQREAEAQAMTEAEREADLRRREQSVEAKNLAWTQIEQQLTIRRQKVDAQVRDHLAANRGSILETLAFDLERTGDVHQWWTQELPHRLRRDLRNVSTQISSLIGRQVAGDVRWLHEELHRQFKFPGASSLAEPAIEVQEVEVVPSSVPLADMQKFRIVSRVGNAATVMLVAIALAHTGVAGMTIAVGSIAGVAADQIARRVAAKDRSAVRAELDRVLQRAWLDLAAQVSAQLKSGYDGLVAALKKEQERWLESQMLALRNTALAAAPVDWRAILEEAQALTADIATKGEES